MKTIEKETFRVSAFTLIELLVVIAIKYSSPPPPDLDVPFLASGCGFRGNQ